MTPYSTPSADLLFVGVKPGAMMIELYLNNLIYEVPNHLLEKSVPIPPGYSLLSAGTADQVSEDEAGKVVERRKHPFLSGYFYKDYFTNSIVSWLPTATKSIFSILRSLKLEPSETVVLFKIKN